MNWWQILKLKIAYTLVIPRDMKEQQRTITKLDMIDLLKDNHIKTTNENIKFLEDANDKELAVHILKSTLGV
jgi:hypothetical protein